MNDALNTWANKWSVSDAALTSLRDFLTHEYYRDSPTLASVPGISETAVQSRVLLESSRKGMLLFRNNVGVLKREDGTPIRYGLANESARSNSAFKSGDLIGIRPVLITQAMVGSHIGQFVSREIKREGWHYTGTDHEQAQLKWAQLIAANGGDACFANAEGTL